MRWLLLLTIVFLAGCGLPRGAVPDKPKPLSPLVGVWEVTADGKLDSTTTFRDDGSFEVLRINPEDERQRVTLTGFYLLRDDHLTGTYEDADVEAPDEQTRARLDLAARPLIGETLDTKLTWVGKEEFTVDEGKRILRYKRVGDPPAETEGDRASSNG